MNGERKEFNKYCGLIMFEPPSQPLNQSIAAGAADVDAFHSINYYNNNNNNNNNEKLPGCLKIKNEKRPPRPPNAFILYRREKQPAILATNRHMTNAEISRYIADLWKNESNETRLMWERYADQQKLNHMKAYPNYVYRPNKSRNEKRRQQRRKQRKATAGSNNNNNNNNNSNDVVDDTSAGSNIATPDISTPITTITTPIVDITNNTISPTTNTVATNNTTAAISMIPMSMGINNNNIYYNPPMDINNYFTQQPERQNVRNDNNFGIVIPQQIVPSSYPISPSSYTSSPISTTSSSPSLNSNSTSSSILSSGPMNHSNNENENNNYLYDNDSNRNNNNLIYDNNNNNNNNDNNNNLIYDNNNICDDSVNGLGLGFSDFLHDPTIINTVYNPTLIDEILRMEYQNYLGGGI